MFLQIFLIGEQNIHISSNRVKMNYVHFYYLRVSYLHQQKESANPNLKIYARSSKLQKC